MRRRVIQIFLVVAVMTFAAEFSAMAAQEEAAPITKMGSASVVRPTLLYI
jgi:hypothetical protein